MMYAVWAALLLAAAPMRAQWVVSDPTNLAQGIVNTVNQIAETLTLSASTVGTHLYNIKQKLNVVNQAELTLIAVRHKLIEA